VPQAPDVPRTLARNTLWNYAGFAVNLATNLVAFPFVVSRLGDAAAGVWLLLSAVTGYMGLLELGLVPSVAQYVAAARGRGTDEDVDRAATTSFALLSLLALVPLILSFATPWLVGWLRVEGALERPAALALQIAIAGFALRMPLATLQALLLGCQRQDRASQLWILMGWSKFACAIVVLQAGGGLVALVAAETAVHLLGGVLQWKWVREDLPALALTAANLDGRTAWHLVSYGASLLVLGLTVLVIEQTDRLVIAAFLPIDQVTLYSAAWKLYMLAYAVPTTLVQALGPMAATLFGSGDRAGMRELFFRMGKYSVAVAIPLVCTLAASREWLLTVWLGERFAAVGPVVIALLVAFYVTAHNHAAWSVLSGMRRLGPFVWSYNGPQAVLNLVLSVALVKPLGILGVALGTLVPALLLQPVFMQMAYRELGVSLRDVVTRIVVPTSGLAVPAFAPLVATCLVAPPASPWRIVVSTGCSLVFVALFWAQGLTSEERGGVGALLPARLRRRLQ
jgi:O-antigen/teichoic acid export membrane protein